MTLKSLSVDALLARQALEAIAETKSKQNNIASTLATDARTTIINEVHSIECERYLQSSSHNIFISVGIVEPQGVDAIGRGCDSASAGETSEDYLSADK